MVSPVPSPVSLNLPFFLKVAGGVWTPPSPPALNRFLRTTSCHRLQARKKVFPFPPLLLTVCPQVPAAIINIPNPKSLLPPPFLFNFFQSSPKKQQTRQSVSHRRLKAQAGRHRHGHELLEEKLACVGQQHLHDLHAFAGVLAALEGLILQIGHRDEAAGLTHVDAIGIRLVLRAESLRA
jgi:hypothetical protein